MYFASLRLLIACPTRTRALVYRRRQDTRQGNIWVASFKRDEQGFSEGCFFCPDVTAFTNAFFHEIMRFLISSAKCSEIVCCHQTQLPKAVNFAMLGKTGVEKEWTQNNPQRAGTFTQLSSKSSSCTHWNSVPQTVLVDVTKAIRQ